MTLDLWANRHDIPHEALAELKVLLGVDQPLIKPLHGQSEAAVQTRVRVEASQKGLRLWRNNVGMLMDENGIPVRFGLANESQQMNKKIKSSDLIGIRPVLIKPHHVGSTIGQFVAREVKRGDWKFTGSDRESAQLKFLELVLSLGGDACFARSDDTL